MERTPSAMNSGIARLPLIRPVSRPYTAPMSRKKTVRKTAMAFMKVDSTIAPPSPRRGDEVGSIASTISVA
ncbi:hypothetical protein SAFG77S_03605 [Streptomyces afghaniensis]